MKVRVPLIVQDPMTARYGGKMVEGFDIQREAFFLDGPVTKRVAVLDFDPVTGALLPGARFQAPSKGRKLGRYELPNAGDIYARDFNQVSVFAAVLKTMYMVEEEDTLGRRVLWAFDSPQLLVVPRAGQWENAFYERESHSLQFFHFPLPGDPGQTIYTSLSRDIVSHETGHAILDGVAPDLYNAITPQALALHEGIADLTALLMAFSSHTLRDEVLKHTAGSIRDSTAFTGIAEQFGSARDPLGRNVSLRFLLNQKTLNPDDTSLDDRGLPNRVNRYEPHSLSEVLSGALYTVMVKIHEQVKSELAAKEQRSAYEVSGKALAIGAARLKRMIFRALDYLPPGEIAFADYGRAIITSDQASHPDDLQERQWICEEFVRRHMVPNLEALKATTNFAYPALQSIDLQTLVDSDWAAYEFANQHRQFLGIPPGIHFRVRPRLDVTKLYYHRGGHERRIRECLFKVSWDHKEANQISPLFPSTRQITVGTTLAIDWETRMVRALLTSNPATQQQKADRDQMLLRLVDEGTLQVGRLALGPDGRLLRSALRAESMDGLMRVRGTARTLHMIKEI